MDLGLYERTLAAIRKRGPVPDTEPDQPPENGIACSRCGNTGVLIRTDEYGNSTAVPCPDCHAKRVVAMHLKHSGISAQDYERYSLARFDPNRSKVAGRMKAMAVKYIDEYKPDGPGFAMFGQSGSGKTHICIAVCQELTKRYRVPHYYFSYVSEMPQLLKAQRSYQQDYDDAMDKWRHCENLYIDDLFKLAGPVQNDRLLDIDRNELKIIFDIINTRRLNRLPTIFSSEFSVDNLLDIDEALGSRIYEMVRPYGLYSVGGNERLRRNR